MVITSWQLADLLQIACVVESCRYATTLDDFKALASGLPDEHNDIEALIKSRSAPDVMNARLQEMHQLLEVLLICGKEIVSELLAQCWRQKVDRGCIEKKKQNFSACKDPNKRARE